MSRPRKCRKVCQLPKSMEFVPADGGDQRSVVVLAVDEYETIRLIDKEGFSQEACGAYMKVARTTVQQIYASARKKLAEALVDGLTLKIEGGDYQLCDGKEPYCGCGGCPRHRRFRGEFAPITGGNYMKIAVTYENGQIFQHFGHTEQFKLYTVDQNKVVKTEIVDTNGSGHGALAGFLQLHGVDVLVCGGIGGGAQSALAAAAIHLFGGASGDADQAVEDLLAGKLVYDPNVACSHHEGHQDHECGSHGCGEHHCGQ